jgi:hypothetical protein
MTAPFLRTLSLTLAALAPVMAVEVGPVEIHGFASQGYLVTSTNNYLIEDSTDGSFAFFEAALNASWQATDSLRVGAQVFSYTLGDLGDYDLALDWAYLDYRPLDEAGLRAGLVKQPRGFYNEYQDIDLARTTIVMPTSLYDPILRDYNLAFYGGDVYGVVGIGDHGDIEYHAYVGTRLPDEEGGVGNYFVNGLYAGGFDSELTKLEQGINYGANLIWNTALPGLRFGISGAIIDEITGEYKGTLRNGAGIGLAFLNGSPMDGHAEVTDYTNWVISAEYAWDDYRITAEYNTVTADIKNTVTVYNAFLPGGQATVIENDPYEPQGGYLQGAYRFHPQWEGAITASHYYATDPSSAASGYQYDYYMSLRYDPYDWLVLKAELHQISGYAQQQQITNPDGRADSNWMGAFKMTASF